MPLGPQPTPLQRWFFASVAMLASIALTWILLRLLSRVVTAITVLLVGATLAYLLAPVADRLEMWVRKRWLAVLILMFVLAVVLFLSSAVIGGTVVVIGGLALLGITSTDPIMYGMAASLIIMVSVSLLDKRLARQPRASEQQTQL